MRLTFRVGIRSTCVHVRGCNEILNPRDGGASSLQPRNNLATSSYVHDRSIDRTEILIARSMAGSNDHGSLFVWLIQMNIYNSFFPLLIPSKYKIYEKHTQYVRHDRVSICWSLHFSLHKPIQPILLSSLLAFTIICKPIYVSAHKIQTFQGMLCL